MRLLTKIVKDKEDTVVGVALATLLEDCSDFQIKVRNVQVAVFVSFLGRDNRRLNWMINISLGS